MNQSPEYILGLRLATATDADLSTALASRPYTLALLRSLNAIVETRTLGLDAFLNPIPKPNINERRLSVIVAPPHTTWCRHNATAKRLRGMQRQLIKGKFPGRVWGSEIDIEEGI